MTPARSCVAEMPPKLDWDEEKDVQLRESWCDWREGEVTPEQLLKLRKTKLGVYYVERRKNGYPDLNIHRTVVSREIADTILGMDEESARKRMRELT
jgi:hypothetical protein